MKKFIIINVSIGETRIAILEDEKLVELYFELPENERMVGDIYLGKVAKIVNGIQAAFVNIGQRQDAFLHFSDINKYILDMFGNNVKTDKRNTNRRNFVEAPVKKGQDILVQITKEPLANKGARITNGISLPGRFLVLMPGESSVGVSRKIQNRKEKYRLKHIGQTIRPKGFGIVVRTVSEGKDEAVLKADLDSLMKSWNKLVKKKEKSNPPCIIHKDMGMLSSVIRDLFTPDIYKLVVDDKKMHSHIVKYLKEVQPKLVDHVEIYKDKEPIFDRYGIESQLNKSLARKVSLKKGGYIFIEHTEALTAIDVNSGSFSGKSDHDSNSLKINLDAAQEIARQLRLRDIGGIIIIDFIDMIDDNNKKRLYDEFYREIKKDRAQVNISKISEFGLIEMTRERVRPALLYTISEPCPACGGTGRVISKTTVVARIERWIKRYKSEGSEKSLQLYVHPELAKYLTTGYRSRIRRISWKYWMRIKVHRDENISLEEFRFLNKSGEEDCTLKFMP
ncbi:Rne/Rng family ribonuclease [candidate division KSB1 bacterium]|nr:Rne/Rng family ribonuclease [candidate division KSB1 bacterium]